MIYYFILRIIISIPFLGNKILIKYYDRLASKYLIRTNTSKNILIVFPAAIGDYVLVRNLIYGLKKQFSKYNYYILCDDVIKDILLSYDSKIYKGIYSLKNPQSLDLVESLFTIQKLNKIGFCMLINPVYSMEYYRDFYLKIVKFILADRKISIEGDKYLTPYLNLMLNEIENIFDEIVPTTSNIIFEIDRLNYFFKSFCNIQSDLNITPLINSIRNENSFILVFPGARQKFRELSIEKYISIINYISNLFHQEIILLGSDLDYNISEEIRTLANSNHISNACGKYNLSQVIELISKSLFIIGNESGPVHIAANLKIPFICFSNANHYTRFNPYPLKYNVPGMYIYPPEIMEYKSQNRLAEDTKYYSKIDINNIIINEQLLNEISKFLINYQPKIYP